MSKAEGWSESGAERGDKAGARREWRAVKSDGEAEEKREEEKEGGSNTLDVGCTRGAEEQKQEQQHPKNENIQTQ